MLSLEETFRGKLRDIYRAAPIDAYSFHRNYKACGPGECLATCCHGGSGFYMQEEPETIRGLLKKHGDFFESQKLDFPEGPFAEELDEETGTVELSTNVRAAAYPAGFFPPHFPATACVFRNQEGACTLQMLSIKQGKHGWWYKPLACWLYPIELEHGGKPFIRVAHASTDEFTDDDYPGFVDFTPCGKECKSGGKPAYKVLDQEIAMLARLLGRDLMSEILAYRSSP